MYIYFFPSFPFFFFTFIPSKRGRSLVSFPFTIPISFTLPGRYFPTTSVLFLLFWPTRSPISLYALFVTWIFLHSTRPCHLHLFSLVATLITLKLFLVYSFLVLSDSVTSDVHLDNLISATFFSSFSRNVQYSDPHWSSLTLRHSYKTSLSTFNGTILSHDIPIAFGRHLSSGPTRYMLHNSHIHLLYGWP